MDWSELWFSIRWWYCGRIIRHIWIKEGGRTTTDYGTGYEYVAWLRCIRCGMYGEAVD